MERLYFIVNLLAGGGRCKKCFQEVEAALKEKGISYGVSTTQYARHATELARSAYENGERTIIAVGGDGTINEVASALLGTDAVMGILPFGTGNDFARAVGIPKEPSAALEVLLSRRIAPVDTGDVNGHFFINVAGFGFDVDVLLNTQRYKTRFKGMLPYLLGIVSALAHLKALPIKIHTAERVLETDALLIAVGNGAYFGGGMMALPNAVADDGLFDICVVRGMGLLRFLTLLPRFIKGKHIGIKQVEYFRAREAYVEGPSSCVINVDGELYSNAPARFTLKSRAIQLIRGM